MKITDEVRFIKLMSDFGVTITKVSIDYGNKTEYKIVAYTPNVEGYFGFFVVFIFTHSGKFCEMGVYE